MARKIAPTRLGTIALLLALLLAQTPAIASDIVVTEEARTRFAAGVVLLQDPKEPRYEEAYREFKEAYRTSPSYRILGNLGLCAMKLERDEEAIWAYEKYLKEGAGDIAPSERDQIERDLLTLRAGLVHVVVSTSPPGASVVDVRTPAQGAAIRTPYGQLLQERRLGLRQGNHTVTAHLDGYEDARWTFEASGHEMPAKVLRLEKIVAPVPAAKDALVVRERPFTTATMIAAGITATAALSSTVLGIAALKQASKFDTLNDGRNPDEAANVRSRGQSLNVATDVALGVTLLAAGATAYFFLTRPTVVQKSATIRLAPMWGSGGPAASVSGSF